MSTCDPHATCQLAYKANSDFKRALKPLTVLSTVSFLSPMTAMVHKISMRSRASDIDPSNINMASLVIFDSLACVIRKAVATESQHPTLRGHPEEGA